jgi:hypothetical protein
MPLTAVAAAVAAAIQAATAGLAKHMVADKGHRFPNATTHSLHSSQHNKNKF